MKNNEFEEIFYIPKKDDKALKEIKRFLREMVATQYYARVEIKKIL